MTGHDQPAAQKHDCEYRIEADKCEAEYDSLLADACLLYEALKLIADGRPNRAFDPWARQEARWALEAVSDRVSDAVPT